MQPRVPGLIGGAGPGATAQIYLDVMARCGRSGLPNRPPLLMASVDIDLAVERRLLHEGVGVDAYLDGLLGAVRALVAAGADFLAMPCNTLHLLHDQMQAASPVPILHIVEAVARRVDGVGCATVGLLSTGATARTGLYQRGLAARDIRVVTIDDALQARLADAIDDEVTQSRIDDTSRLRRDILATFGEQGACAVIAGCTELKALMANWRLPLPVIDSLDALGAMVFEEMVRDLG
ncbi:MAG: amino acid racemase [Candidatus Krumholzibacteriia bacterium]